MSKWRMTQFDTCYSLLEITVRCINEPNVEKKNKNILRENENIGNCATSLRTFRSYTETAQRQTNSAYKTPNHCLCAFKYYFCYLSDLIIIYPKWGY